MKLLISLFILLVSIPTAFTKTPNNFKLKSSSDRNFPNTLNGRDFFISKSSSYEKSKETTNCRDQIRQAICLVDPVKENEVIISRFCQEGSQAYAIYFENLYDNYPPALQQMFCSVKKIFIEKKFGGTAYASYIENDQGKRDGAFIGIRKSVLDESLDLTTWASWKEQLSFGGIKDSYTVTSDLPQITAFSKAGKDTFLYFVITHEFGHLFDFANNLNKQENCPEPKPGTDESPECKMAAGSWGSISWDTDLKTNPESDFKNRSGLCFYSCNDNHLSKEDVPDLYQSLLHSNFISSYASTNPWDDFAESLAYFTVDQNLSAHYEIDTKQGEKYDSILKLTSPVFEQKLKYIKEFITRTDIAYP